MKSVMKNIILVAFAWLGGTTISKALASALHLPLPSLPESAGQAEGFGLFVLASVLLAAGTALTAGRLGGVAVPACRSQGRGDLRAGRAGNFVAGALNAHRSRHHQGTLGTVIAEWALTRISHGP